MSFAPRVMLNEADLAGDRADPAGQPRQLPPRAWPRRPAATPTVRRVRRTGPRSADQGRARCAACASSRCESAGPRCARRWTAPRSSSTSSRCWRRCWRRWRWRSRRATSRSATSTTARCCACSACRSARSRCRTAWSSRCVGLLASVAGVAARLRRAPRLRLAARRAGRRPTLPPPGLWPALFGLGVGLTLLVGFGLPPVLQLARVPPLRVIRRDVGALKPASLPCWRPARLGFAALLLAVSSRPEARAASRSAASPRAVARVRAAVVARACGCCRRAVPEARAPRWLVLATRQIAARPAFAVLQVSALGGRPAGAGAAGAAAHRPDRRAGARPRRRMRRTASSSTCSPTRPRRSSARCATRASTRYDWFPMIRGRLVAINGKPVGADGYADDRARAPGRPRVQPEPQRDAAGAQRGVAPAAGRADEADAAQRRGRAGADARPQARRHAALRHRRAARARAASPACARSTGARCASTSSSCSRARRWPTCRSATSARSARRTTPGFDNALARDFPNITNDRRVGVDRAGAARARPGGARGRVPVRLHARRRPGGAVRRGERHARGARARVRGDARAGRERQAAGAGAARRAARRRRAGRPARLAGGGGGRLGAGALCVRVQLERRRRSVPLVGAAAGALLALAAGWWGLREVLRRPVVETLRQAAEVLRDRAHASRRHTRRTACRPRPGNARCASCTSRIPSLDHELAIAHLSHGGLQVAAERVESEAAVHRGARVRLGRGDLRLQPARLFGPGGARAAEGARPRRAVHPAVGRDRRGDRGRGDAQRRERLPAEVAIARLVPALLHAVDAAETRRARERADRELLESKERLTNWRSTCRPVSSTSAPRSRARSTTMSAAR